VRPSASTRRLAIWLGVLALFGQVMIPTYSMAIGSGGASNAVPICTAGGTVWVTLDEDGWPVEKQDIPANKPCHFCFGPSVASSLPQASPTAISFSRSISPVTAQDSMIVAGLPISPLPIRAPPATA